MPSTSKQLSGDNHQAAMDRLHADVYERQMAPFWAIDQKGIDFKPDLVISGINAGQNMGPVVAASGTVGAARAAATRGIPAVATSQGPIAPPQDFPASVAQVLTWLEQNMAAVTAGTLPTTTITNLNAPTCATGAVRGPLLPEQSREDTDAAWGEYTERADDRLYRDRPPHWDDF